MSCKERDRARREILARGGERSQAWRERERSVRGERERSRARGEISREERDREESEKSHARREGEILLTHLREREQGGVTRRYIV